MKKPYLPKDSLCATCELKFLTNLSVLNINITVLNYYKRKFVSCQKFSHTLICSEDVIKSYFWSRVLYPFYEDIRKFFKKKSVLFILTIKIFATFLCMTRLKFLKFFLSKKLFAIRAQHL